ncbi:hypothetical protein L218DRAFT_691903 [Marasmius fiardii PR-910]|nr:hypothetical protein L218DRAFT_691903 [Marasmius fiardii PR-910]
MPRTTSKVKKATKGGSPAGRAVICPLCSKTISRKNDLRRHILTHNKDKSTYPFGCPHPNCEFRSLQESNLKTHFKTHTGVKDKVCPHVLCVFATGDPGSLTRHRKRKHEYVPRPRRKYDNGAVVTESPSSTTSSSSRSTTPESSFTDVCFSPFSSPRSFTSILTPDYIANLILRPASFDQSAIPGAAMLATGSDDARIVLPSISTWYRDEEDSRPLYELNYRPSPSVPDPCSGYPECDRRF